MKRIFILSFAFFICYHTGLAQACMHFSQELKSSIAKLGPPFGQWKGEGWIQMGASKLVFQQHENISLKANNTVLQIEGLGNSE